MADNKIRIFPTQLVALQRQQVQLTPFLPDSNDGFRALGYSILSFLLSQTSQTAYQELKQDFLRRITNSSLYYVKYQGNSQLEQILQQGRLMDQFIKIYEQLQLRANKLGPSQVRQLLKAQFNRSQSWLDMIITVLLRSIALTVCFKANKVSQTLGQLANYRDSFPFEALNSLCQFLRIQLQIKSGRISIKSAGEFMITELYDYQGRLCLKETSQNLKASFTSNNSSLVSRRPESPTRFSSLRGNSKFFMSEEGKSELQQTRRPPSPKRFDYVQPIRRDSYLYSPPKRPKSPQALKFVQENPRVRLFRRAESPLWQLMRARPSIRVNSGCRKNHYNYYH